MSVMIISHIVDTKTAGPPKNKKKKPSFKGQRPANRPNSMSKA
jgi:hypothetical protein